MASLGWLSSEMVDGDHGVSTGSGSDWSASVLACYDWSERQRGNRDSCAPVLPGRQAPGTDLILNAALSLTPSYMLDCALLPANCFKVTLNPSCLPSAKL